MTDNTMAKRKRRECQTMIYRKLKIVMRNTKPSKMIYRKLKIVMRNTKPSKMIYRKLKIVMRNTKPSKTIFMTRTRSQYK